MMFKILESGHYATQETGYIFSISKLETSGKSEYGGWEDWSTVAFLDRTQGIVGLIGTTASCYIGEFSSL